MRGVVFLKNEAVLRMLANGLIKIKGVVGLFAAAFIQQVRVLKRPAFWIQAYLAMNCPTGAKFLLRRKQGRHLRPNLYR